MSVCEMDSSCCRFIKIEAVSVCMMLLFSVGYGNGNGCNNNFECGKIKSGYPFWGNKRVYGCGVPELELKCEKNSTTLIEMNKIKYKVMEIEENAQTLKIARQDYYENGICEPQFVNTTVDPHVFEYASGYRNLTILYGCPLDAAAVLLGASAAVFSCPGSSFQTGFVIWEANNDPGFGLCYASVYVPVSLSLSVFSLSTLESSLKQGFEVKWRLDDHTVCTNCITSKGACGFDIISNKTTCYSIPLPGGKSKSVGLGVGLGIAGASVVGIGLGCWFLLIVQKRKRVAAQSQSKDIQTPPTPLIKGQAAPIFNFSRTTPSYPSSKSDIEKGSTYFGTQVFSYEELVEATDNFNPSKELGDGGFGTVYYGILNDGRVVAVKRLYDNNIKRAEQFMNEVEILTRLRHKNLVTLYGCTSRRSQELLLVYEYIPNGTVADHLHGNRTKSSLLSWRVRLSIAIETADALAYLHTSDVIHRDVKTNNILLDNNFHVKVADFGLSRLFPNDVSHVSTAPQGTPGYVDPEYYQCYQLTDKSDVYSFGVVLVELLSSLQAVDTNRNRLDINLANMAVTKIQNHLLKELVDPLLGFENDNEVRKMTTSVAELAFRCLQQERDMRPNMTEVMEGLKKIEYEHYGSGKVEAVDIKEDDVGLLNGIPDSAPTDKWVSSSTTTTTTATTCSF
ncbi:LEAF RUST 10 DISEASE-RESISTANCEUS RECEPTOR-LIKE PROTEIN KINASE-like 1.4 isoform X2 [Euphorbia lathyris]|uniref:LEAF RUST 10 DISEASE-RESISTANCEUS RECEPTOR-LIKE PROTEIN KINASE-like 1.4 isoform X2 n=1 Tax=Euphorbia lathyris TaxID=212925 RepID=UPI003313B5A2